MSKENILILTATATEKHAINNVLQHFYTGEYERGDEQNHCILRCRSVNIHIVHLMNMGNLHSTLRSSDLIRKFHPVCLIACGVCAGIPTLHDKKNTPMGSILAGNTVIYYEIQKIHADDEIEFRPAFNTSSISQRLFNDFIKINFSADQTKYLNTLSPIGKNTPTPTIQEAVYASGEKVVNNSKFRDKLKEKAAESNQLIRALDMESAGIAYACSDSATNFIIAKSLCDFAAGKDDIWQTYAATVSAMHVFNWCKTLSEDDITNLLLDRNFDLPPSDYEKMKFLAKIAGKNLSIAGSPIMRHKGGHDTDDIVTKFDILNQKLFNKHLGDSCTMHGEEELDSVQEENTTAGRPCVYVDPVDGTLNFHAGRPEVAISVAQYHHGEPISAAINLPFREMTISATTSTKIITVNNAAWSKCRPEPYEISDAFVSLPGDIKKLRNIGEDDDILYSIICLFAKSSRIIRISGALAYDLATLALGEIDVRISTFTKDIDAAAGAILVRQSGGVVTDFFGNNWKPSSLRDGYTTQLVASSNPKLHDKVLHHITSNIDSIKLQTKQINHK